MVVMKQAKLIERRDKEVKWYNAQFDRQTERIENEKSFITICSKKRQPKLPPKKIAKIVENLTIKRESSEQCQYTQVGKIKMVLRSFTK